MADINYLTAIRLAHGAVAGLSEDLERFSISRPLFVVDRGIVAAGLMERAREAAGIADPVIYDETPPNPTEEAVEAALATYRSENCDGVVALGGGSPIDLAKGVALMAAHDGPLVSYALIEGGLARITNDLPPLIAIPTTAGTGSEVGRGAIISFRDGRKLGLISPRLIPRLAICDPELTLGLPASLTAATGMDAFTHCVETYLSPKVNPTADAIALDGLGRAARNIEEAVFDGASRAARMEMMIAALHGGLTFQKGLGAVHALSHPLGGLRSVSLHHGTLNAMILPYMLRLGEGAAPEKYAVLRGVLGLPAGADLADHVTGLVERLGLPSSLGAFGVKADIVPEIAAAALRDHSHPTNVRPLAEADYAGVLKTLLAA